MGAAGNVVSLASVLTPQTSIAPDAPDAKESGVRLCEGADESGERPIVKRHPPSEKTAVMRPFPRLAPPPPALPRFSSPPAMPHASVPPPVAHAYPAHASMMPLAHAQPHAMQHAAAMQMAAVQALMVAVANGWIVPANAHPSSLPPAPQPQQVVAAQPPAPVVIEAPMKRGHSLYVVASTALIAAMGTMLALILTGGHVANAAPAQPPVVQTAQAMQATQAMPIAMQPVQGPQAMQAMPQVMQAPQAMPQPVQVAPAPVVATTSHHSSHASAPVTTATPVDAQPAPAAPPAAHASTNADAQKKLDDAARSREMLRAQLDASLGH